MAHIRPFVPRKKSAKRVGEPLDPKSPLEKAIELLGGTSATARKLGVATPQVVQNWRQRRRVPPEYCEAIENATDGQVTGSELRPEIFGDNASSLPGPTPDTEQVPSHISTGTELPTEPGQSVCVAAATYVTVQLAGCLTGLGELAIQRKIADGKWVEGREYRLSPDGELFVSLNGFSQWVERGRS